MKIKFNLIIIFACLSIFFISCEEKEIDVPSSVGVPYFNGKATHSISQLKKMCKIVSNKPVLTAIDSDVIIKGTVVSSDQTGNFYEAIYIQDDSAGLKIGIIENSLYLKYAVGQRIFIKCKGLYLNESPEGVGIFYKDSLGNYGSFNTDIRKRIIFRDSMPNTNIKPIIVKNLADAQNDKYIGRLIQLDSVVFADSGKVYSSINENAGGNATSRYIKQNATSLLMRNSIYATFYKYKMPGGVLSVTGIMSKYYATGYQFYIRDLNDVKKFK